MDADAIVVGSGAGGGPVAATLAEAGLRVLVLEAGPRVETGQFTGDALAMVERIWTLNLARPRHSLYAGACVGGSTVVNDALCFRTPPEITAEWRDVHGLTGLTDAAMAPWVERAWADVHASPTTMANTSRNAAALARGAARLGWANGPTPRNVTACANLGRCNLGCPTGAKQSTLLTYVPRAERAGARVVPDTRVERIRIAGGAVTGVEARLADGTVAVVEAPLVCVAAGVLQTPALLQRSGVASAGRGLAFHSSTHVTARFRDPIHGYYGPTMGWAIHEFSDVDGRHGPGIMIENTGALPMAAAAGIAGFGARHGRRMTALPHLARALVVIRDRARGTMDADGATHYALEADDLARLVSGMDAAARAYLAAGAEAVWLPISDFPTIRQPRDLDALDARRLAADDLSMLYAVHLFGGAAMGTTCDEDGAVRGVRGLYVSDAAALPTTTGVNPQITIMANALRIAGGIVATRGRA